MPITTPTVLILGAGASKAYGFPLGRELRDIVCRLLEKPGLFVELGHSEAHVKAFRHELRYAAYRSVDQFLERNEAFMAIGKQAIAAALLPAEDENRLFSPGAPDEHWYELLVDRMAVDTDDWFKNRLSVITFNYDRSLEHFFTRVISQRCRTGCDESYARFREVVPVVHVHGSLGDYPNLAYGENVGAKVIDQAAQKLLVVSEAKDTLPTFSEAFKHLQEGLRLYFLGFGFNRDNVRRLRFFDPAASAGTPPTIGGTVAGFVEREWQTIQNEVLHGRWTGPRSSEIYDLLRRLAELS